MKNHYTRRLTALGKFFFLLPFLLFAQAKLQAQAGTLDATFNPGDTSLGAGLGPNSLIYAVAVQPDGKIIIGGGFTSYNNILRSRLVRLNTDGSIDNSFNIGAGVQGTVNSIVLQADGKIVIAGTFSAYNGVARARIARINSDGSLDTSFDPGTGANNTISVMKMQADQKLVIGGEFTRYNDAIINRIARINTDGSLDGTFNVGTGVGAAVSALEIQSNGKILIGGSFTTYNNVSRPRMARINADGTVDNTFNNGTAGADGKVSAIAELPNGNILIGGAFTSYNGTARNRFIRVSSTGVLDASFNSGGTGPNNTVSVIAIQPDGKILIGGSFGSYNTTTRSGIIGLNSDGTVDNSFIGGTNVNGTVTALASQPDGKMLVGGGFVHFNNLALMRLVRINSDGSRDESFNPFTGANGTIHKILEQPDGKMIIVGDFTVYNSAGRGRIARINADGSLDASFNPGAGADGVILAATLMPDGKILIGGNFTTYDGVSRTRFARVNSDGSLDAGFTPGAFSGPLNVMKLLPDGKLLIGGSFSSYLGTSINNIARLNSNGTLDATFNPGQGVLGGTPYAFAELTDGKYLVFGNFTTYDGVSRPSVARINNNGSLDLSFTPGTGGNGVIFNGIVQADGKITIAGGFNMFNGVSRNYVARLNADGTLDNSFDPGTGANSTVSSLEMQSDGKFIITGFFTTYNSITRNRIARLNSDGSLDTSFDPGTGANAAIQPMIILSDGNLMIGGSFTSYNDIGRTRLARVLISSGTLPVTLRNIRAHTASTGIMVEWQVEQETGILAYEVERSTNGRSYTRIGAVPASANGTSTYSFNDITATAGNMYYYRLRITEADGSSKYSPVVSLRISNVRAGITFYPNPVQTGSLQLQLTNKSAGKYVLRLISTAGQSVYQSSINHAGSSSTSLITLPAGIKNGLYYLEVKGPKGEKEVLKVSVKY